MAKLTKRELKKFWEWCGIKYEPDQDCFKVIFPDGEWYNFGQDWKMGRMEPPLDLNNLFKYAVPKVVEELRARPDVRHIHNAYGRLFNMWLEELFSVGYKELAAALYQAIQKARKKDEK